MQKKPKKKSKLQKKTNSRKLFLLGNFLIGVGLAILILVFWPVASQEIKYDVGKTLNLKTEKGLTPPDKNFSIVIPKINAASKIIPNVDPYNPKIYLSALREGVAQALGTVEPGMVGNVYLFAHSTDAFYDVNTYNAVFFLIGKLENGDEIDIYYKNRLIKYSVYDKRVVDSDSVEYIGTIFAGEKTLTLQTCYPPGTTLKRLIVLAKEI